MLRELVKTWFEKIDASLEKKYEEFSCYAKEIRAFYDRPHDHLYDRDSKYGLVTNVERPPFGMTVNKTAEAAELLIPSIIFRNPVRKVGVRQMTPLPEGVWGDLGIWGDPMMAQQAMMMDAQVPNQREIRSVLMGDLLNYTPGELDLYGHTKRMTLDVILTGAGFLWQEVYQPVGMQSKLVGSFHESVTNIIFDPDATWVGDAMWCGRRKMVPKWELEQQWGLKPDAIRGQRESSTGRAHNDRDKDGPWRRAKGESNDLVEVWEIYSKMGVGSRLKGKGSYAAELDAIEDTMSVFGDFVFLVLVRECDYPLNMQPKQLRKVREEDPESMQTMLSALEWPTPFYADANGWPFVMLDPYLRPDSPWPMSILMPALGEQKAIDWLASLMLQKIKVTCNDTVLMVKHVVDKMKKVRFGKADFPVVEVDRLDRSMAELVHILQFPPMNRDIIELFQIFTTAYQDRTGVSELMMGRSSRQMRSAAEADIKQQNTAIRPDDIAKQMEDTQGRAARQEAICARWHLKGQDVLPFMGQARAMLWDQVVRTSSLEEVVRELDYTVAANSMRRPDKQKDVEDANEVMQVIMPALMTLGQANPPANFPAINAALDMFATSRDLPEGTFHVEPPLPPPPMMPPAGGPPPGEGGPPPGEQPPAGPPPGPPPGAMPPPMPGPAPMPQLPPEIAAMFGIQ